MPRFFHPCLSQWLDYAKAICVDVAVADLEVGAETFLEKGNNTRAWMPQQVNVTLLQVVSVEVQIPGLWPRLRKLSGFIQGHR